MTEIYVIRHTQAEGNLYRMMQGHWDGEVTPFGLRQIDALAERLKDVKIDAVYSSDLRRTRATAAAITRYHDVPVQLDKRLREIHVGRWETIFFADVIRNDPEIFHNFINAPEDFELEGAETFAQVRQRVVEAVREIAEKNEDKSIAIVSHGIAIRCMVSGICGISLNDLEKLPLVENTSVSRLNYENGIFTPVYINDYSHLGSELTTVKAKALPLRHEYVDPAQHRDYYITCYRDAWLAAHGNLTGFDGEIYYSAALEHYRADRESVAIIYDNDSPVGLVDMDTQRGAHANYGWISLVYLKEEYRRRGLGIQLLARAIVKYMAMERSALRLLVAEENTAARRFYAGFGFRELSSQPGATGRLLLMERRFGDAYGLI